MTYVVREYRAPRSRNAATQRAYARRRTAYEKARRLNYPQRGNYSGPAPRVGSGQSNVIRFPLNNPSQTLVPSKPSLPPPSIPKSGLGSIGSAPSPVTGLTPDAAKYLRWGQFLASRSHVGRGLQTGKFFAEQAATYLATREAGMGFTNVPSGSWCCGGPIGDTVRGWTPTSTCAQFPQPCGTTTIASNRPNPTGYIFGFKSGPWADGLRIRGILYVGTAAQTAALPRPSFGRIHKPLFLPKVAPAPLPYTAVPFINQPSMGLGVRSSNGPRNRGTANQKAPKGAYNHKNKTIGRNGKEKKAKTPAWLAAMTKAAFGATEMNDLIESLFEALPKDIQEKAPKSGRCRGPRCRNEGAEFSTPLDKAKHLYKNWDSLSMPDALRNIVANQIEDAIMGRINAKADKRRQQAGGSGWGFAT